jgi:8-oxo-dGTP pyrophosphatase MutT (NUDIX family)
MAPGTLHKHCNACNTTDWLNPRPIAVAITQVYDDTDPTHPALGVLIGQRGIEPKRGLYGLPSGWVEYTDHNYEQAAVREQSEEVQFSQVTGSRVVPGGLLCSLPGDPGQILAFSATSVAIALSTLQYFVPNAECPAVRVAWEPEQLCFNSHTQALCEYFPVAHLRNNAPLPGPTPHPAAHPYQVYINGRWHAGVRTEQEAWSVIGGSRFGSTHHVTDRGGYPRPEFTPL